VSAPPPAAQLSQLRNPLHGLTPQAIVTALVAHYVARIPVPRFTSDPRVPSSLKFMRKSPWAREKVESLILFMLRDEPAPAKASLAEKA
jgi:uncharacterized protein (DUF2132 family)